MAAQEQANSIAEGSAAPQQGPQGPHLPQTVVDLSGVRENQGASRKGGSNNGCHGSTTRRLHVLFSVFTAGRQTE